MQDNTQQIVEPPKVGFLDWLLYIPFLLSFALVLLVFDPIQRIALLISRHAHEQTVIYMNRGLMLTLKLVGVSFRIHGEEKIDANGPFIVVANHQSLFDIPALHWLFRKNPPRFISKKELARFLPSVSYNLRYGQNAIIDRSDPQQAIPEIKKLGALIEQQNLAAVLFPEGTRTKTGAVGKYRVSGFSALYETAPSARIIPVVIDDSWKLAKKKKLQAFPLGTTVTIIIGDEMKREDFKGPIEMLRAIHDFTVETINELRAEHARIGS